MVYYVADNSRLCVRRIVLALVKCRKFDQYEPRRSVECALGRILFRGFILGILQPHRKHGRDCAPFLCRDRNKGQERKVKSKECSAETAENRLGMGPRFVASAAHLYQLEIHRWNRIVMSTSSLQAGQCW